MILTFFGPAGAGKGTQAKYVSGRFGLAHLSTGDLLRAERQAGTALGRKTDEIMNRGELVPDEIVRDIVRQHAKKILAAGKGILFDGYPRNMGQLRDLDRILNDLGVRLDLGISLDIHDDRLLRRLTARRVCPNPQCQKVYNLISKPPKVEGICDACGGKLFQRGDDQPDAISKRLQEYHSQTEPMLEALRGQGKLRTVDADLSIEEVRRQLETLIAEQIGGARVG
ncbi:nucleoside monophosphate kinase [Candidatus Sumerlaeota bacterium]|nr:nucleoside monophosphate kinase [Candidatus Sumerlaeota bacterium]MBI3735615.1 nucleoside monophosphate kinase [Candidatus Sumerlaeota bacterium]